MSNEAQSWPDLAIGLYDRLTGRGAEITYEAIDLSVDVPSRVGDTTDRTRWVLNGTMKVRTKDTVAR